MCSAKTDQIGQMPRLISLWVDRPGHTLAHFQYSLHGIKACKHSRNYKWYHILKIVYGKCSKILNTFPLLFSNKMLLFRTGTRKKLARITNGKDPDQTASSEAI